MIDVDKKWKENKTYFYCLLHPVGNKCTFQVRFDESVLNCFVKILLNNMIVFKTSSDFDSLACLISAFHFKVPGLSRSFHFRFSVMMGSDI